MSGLSLSLRSRLTAFGATSAKFRILYVLDGEPSPGESAHRLYVLDSSFNPPTRAHHGILTAALQADTHLPPVRVLLLLATQNADKAPKPAAFEQRLEMMMAFAQDVLDNIRATFDGAKISVDIGVTKLPYFVDKSSAIAQAPEYKSSSLGEVAINQTHLVGYDTLIRILNPKYYPPDHTLQSLRTLFDRHNLRVMLRTDEELCMAEEQREYIERLGEDPPTLPGWRPEWAKQIDVDEASGDEAAMSSTKAREAATQQDSQRLELLCSKRVAQYVIERQPYSDPESG